ncbi:hypothetical protein, partial [Pantoea ananatis]
MTKQYEQRNIESLDGYMTHVMAMTAEQLHSKSDIAGELAWRDSQIAALQQKLDAMAAENAALKSNLMFWDAEDPESPYDCPEDIANNCCMDFNTEFDVQVAAKMPNRTYRVSEVGEYDCKIELVSGGMPEIPATDAYLNSVRAEGVEMFANKITKTVSDEGKPDSHHAYAYIAMNFADKLRSGTHDTAD